MARIALKPAITQGEGWCRAEIDELSISYTSGTKEGSLRGLAKVIEARCQFYTSHPFADGSSEVHELAADILKYGLVFVDVELDHQRLAEKLERVPHLEGHGFGGLARVGDEHVLPPPHFCVKRGGRCSIQDEIALLKIIAVTTSRI